MKITCLYCDIRNHMMNCLDLTNEGHKVFVSAYYFNMEKPSKSLIKKIQKSIIKNNSKENEIIFMGGENCPIYFKKQINQISNGKIKFLFADFIKEMGYKYKVDEHMCVTEVFI